MSTPTETIRTARQSEIWRQTQDRSRISRLLVPKLAESDLQRLFMQPMKESPFGRKDSRAHQGTSTGGQGRTGVAVLCTGIAIGSSATRLERHGTRGGHVTDGRCGALGAAMATLVAACAKTLVFGAVILAEIVGGGANFPLREASRRPRKFRARNLRSGPQKAQTACKSLQWMTNIIEGVF